MSERSKVRLSMVPIEFVPLLIVGASVILGSVLGEAAYYAVTGRAAASVGVLPWWMVAVFAAGAIVLALRWRGATIRAALVLFAIGECMTLTLPRRLALVVMLVAVILIQIACWRLATGRVKGFAVLAVVIVTALRYWSIHNWYSIAGRYRGLGD